MINKKLLKETIDLTFIIVFFNIGTGVGSLSLFSFMKGDNVLGVFFGIISIISFIISFYYYLRK